MKDISLSLPGGYNIQPPAGVPTGGLGAGEGGQKALQVGITAVFIIGIILAVVFVIVSGIQWVLSGGDKQKLQNARNRLTYSIIGLIVIVASFLIVSVVIQLLGGNPEFFFKGGRAGFNCVNKNCSENQTCIGTGFSSDTICLQKGVGGTNAYCGTPDKSPNNESCTSGSCNPQTLRCD